VSWIVAPEGYSEHGNWPANFGAWYVSQVHEVDPGETLVQRFALARSFGWYDIALTADSDPSFRCQIAASTRVAGAITWGACCARPGHRNEQEA